MAGANSAYNQTQAFNKQLYDPTGQGAGLQNDFKVQLSDAAAKIAGAGGRRARNQGVQGLHQIIWNNPNIPNELKQALADYATYQPRVRGDGSALKQSMGGDVVPPQPVRRKKKPAQEPAVQTEPAKAGKKNRMKAKTASMPEPAPAPEPKAPATELRKRRLKAMEE